MADVGSSQHAPFTREKFERRRAAVKAVESREGRPLGRCDTCGGQIIMETS